MTYKNIIASGCSFTQDGIGGAPPSGDTPGGNSFVYDVDVGEKTPASWASFIAQKLQPQSFINTAASSHGNMLVCQTIVDLLNKYNYSPDNTLIIFNISNFYRYDVMCDRSNIDSSAHTPWDEDLLNYNFLDLSSATHKNVTDHISIEHMRQQSVTHLRLLFNFLENQKYNFKFLWMEDYSEDFENDKFLSKYINRLMLLESSNNMIDFCCSKQLTVSDKDFHPNTQGHQIISELVLDQL